MKTNYFFLLFFLFNVAYFQAQVVCRGKTSTYSVDTNEGGVPTPNGTAGSTYAWRIIEANSATITGDGTNRISINWGTTVAGTYTIGVQETNASCSAPAAYTGSTNTNTITITNATLAMAGNYVVTVTDVDDCESSATAVLTVNSLPSAAITTATSTEFCAGGNVVLSAPTGFSYVWNRDGTPIAPLETGGSYTASLEGNYTVTTTDFNTCSNTTTNPGTLVTVNPNPTVTVTASVTEFCDGLNATLSAVPDAGTGPFTYQWMNTLGNITIDGTNENYIASTTSDYRVRVTDSKGCNVTSGSQTINNWPNPDATITALTSTTFCDGDNVVLQRGSAPSLNYTYQWINNTVDIPGSTNFNYTATESGSYKVRVVDTTYPTNCTTITASPIVVTKTNLPVTSSINY